MPHFSCQVQLRQYSRSDEGCGATCGSIFGALYEGTAICVACLSSIAAGDDLAIQDIFTINANNDDFVAGSEECVESNVDGIRRLAPRIPSGMQLGLYFLFSTLGLSYLTNAT